MKPRIAAPILVGILALAFAAQAIADPPVINSPPSPSVGQSLTAGDPIVFSATPASGTPDELEFYISHDDVEDANGVLANRFDIVLGHATSSGAYEGSPDQSDGWPRNGGTYFWQAVHRGCPPTMTPECATDPRQLTIVEPPPAGGGLLTQAVPQLQVETYLKKKPRRRTRKRKVKFRFSSNLAGARFRCLFAEGWTDCRSPHVFRRLVPGRYQFRAQAIVNGVEDPTPAKWVFRVLPRRRR